MSDTEDLPETKLPVPVNLTSTRIPEGEPPESYSALGKDYPLSLVAGGLALGLLAGALLPRGAGRKIVRGAISLAAVAGEAGRIFGHQALEAAEDSREKLGEMGDNAGNYGRKVADAASQSARKSRDLGINLAREVIRMVSELRH